MEEMIWTTVVVMLGTSVVLIVLVAVAARRRRRITRQLVAKGLDLLEEAGLPRDEALLWQILDSDDMRTEIERVYRSTVGGPTP